MLFHRIAVPLVLAVALVTSFGCSKHEPIRSYSVDKPPALAPVAKADPHAGLAGMGMPSATPQKPPTGEPTDRTLGAILPLEPQGWFFKLTGPIAAVAAQESAFTDFLRTVKFDDQGEPTWTLPDGWQRLPGNQFRYATLKLPEGDGPPLEITVSALPNAGGDNTNYILINVNRWRNQLQLPPITAAQLPAESTEIKLEAATATMVNLAGHATAGPPFASGAPNGN